MKLERCRALFQLDKQFSPEHLKTSYKELALTWHPDRFSVDSDLRLKAEEKMKEVNLAYEILTTHLRSNQVQSSDLRCYPRRNCTLAVYHTSHNQPCSSLHDSIENLSPAGLFLRTTANYKVGQRLRLNFSLPKFGELIDLSGKVVHKTPVGVGIKFQISDTYRKFLTAII